jgi:RNA polymerase sigma factor (sigma-70 family)
VEDVDYQDRFQSEIIALLPALTAFSRRLHGNRPDVDDLVQETVLKALLHRDQFTRGSNLKSWLFTIMKNAYCSRFAVNKREVTGIEDLMDNLSTMPEQDWLLMCQDVERSI